MNLILIAVGAYFWIKYKDNSPPTDTAMTVPTNNVSVQPSNQVGRKYSLDPRVDTANQPWYGGDQTFQAINEGVGDLATTVQDLWWNLDNHNQAGNKDPYSNNIGGTV